jgi:hypothetical protein
MIDFSKEYYRIIFDSVLNTYDMEFALRGRGASEVRKLRFILKNINETHGFYEKEEDYL